MADNTAADLARGHTTVPHGKANVFISATGLTSPAPLHDQPAPAKAAAGEEILTSPTVTVRDVQRDIHHAVLELKRLRTDSMSVVLRPDVRTELELQLNMRGSVIEVEAQLRRGDHGNLSAHWSQLQLNLAQQGVRVGALQETTTPGQQNFFMGHPDRQANSQPSERDELIAGSTPKPPSVPGAARNLPGRVVAGAGRSWETWA